MDIKGVGLGLVFAGIIVIVGHLAYVLIQDVDMPSPIKFGLIGMFLGLFILLISLVRERLKEGEK